MTDNAWAYRWSLRDICTANGITQKFIKPHCPWQNGKVERFNRPAGRMGLPAGLHQQRRPSRLPISAAVVLGRTAWVAFNANYRSERLLGPLGVEGIRVPQQDNYLLTRSVD